MDLGISDAILKTIFEATYEVVASIALAPLKFLLQHGIIFDFDARAMEEVEPLLRMIQTLMTLREPSFGGIVWLFDKAHTDSGRCWVRPLIVELAHSIVVLVLLSCRWVCDHGIDYLIRAARFCNQMEDHTRARQRKRRRRAIDLLLHLVDFCVSHWLGAWSSF